MFWHCLAFLARLILSLRYSVSIRGLDELKKAGFPKRGGILFLPNHTAHIDPVLLFLYLWPTFRMRPFVVDYVFRERLLRPFMRLVGALPIPDFDAGVNSFKIHRAEQTMARVLEELRKKQNILLYPSGRLKSSGKEVLGGASGLHALLQECPDANVVLIRTSGLWGSIFSRAIEGRSPKISTAILKGIRILLRCGIFFAPRRRVVIEISLEPADFPRGTSRIELNRYLEHWYNQFLQNGKRFKDEPLTIAPYSPCRRVVPTVFQSKQPSSASTTASIPEETRTQIYAEIKRILNRTELAIEESMSLALDLGLDSLNIADLSAYLSRKYDVDHLRPEQLDTVRDALEIAAGLKESEVDEDDAPKHSWPSETTRPQPVLPMGRTLPEAFLLSCDRLKSKSAIGDDTSGTLSYTKLKRTALVLAEHFRTYDNRFIGILLPASVGAYVTILAVQLAGKVPVMLNWTLGPRYLEEMAQITGVDKVITSWRFVDRLSHVDFGKLEKQLVFLEDIRASLSLKQKLRGAWRSSLRAGSVLNALRINDLDENSPAVVLFTSGTESSPKAVPLSHKNILSNLRSGIQCIDLRKTDVIYGILPPFHSFGFTVAGLVSIFTGMRLALYPDPTNSGALAKGIARWKGTIFCGAPSFLKGVFAAAKPGELDSVRLFVSGAEKTPRELYDKVRNLQTEAVLCEGYGITECSPIITLNRPNLPPKGVGMPLPDVQLITIHPETLAPLAAGVEGEICVHGPNVFHGYLGRPRVPFIELHGKTWYRTGDLGFLDQAGHLILSGRLKRFIKVGGEMISLGAVEDAISAQVKTASETPQIALCADERTEERAELVVFSTHPLDIDTVNEWLKQAGFSRLVKIASVVLIEEIPLMGSGKTDYRRLSASLPK